MNDIKKIVIIFIIITLMVLFIPNLDNSYIISDKLYITEIMANNTYTYKDDYEEYSDYIEIYNGYKTKINLLGYYLSDSEYETSKWQFPNITINPGEYLIVFASGKDGCDLTTKICHTNFKLSSNGETLTLTDKMGNIINKFAYPELSNDEVYGYIKGKYKVLNIPTPKSKNNDSIKNKKISNKDIYINEYMISNKTYSYDSLGNYNDFLELYNNSKEGIELKNIYLSDDIDNLNKYKLPNMKIKSKEYLLVYLGEYSLISDDEIIANFKLSENDKYIILSDGKKIIDKVEIVSLSDNVSYGKKDNKWYYFTKPTPGDENNTKPLSSLGGTK